MMRISRDLRVLPKILAEPGRVGHSRQIIPAQRRQLAKRPATVLQAEPCSPSIASAGYGPTVRPQSKI